MKKALSLVEVTVSLVIVLAIVIGLIATFLSVQRYVMRANVRLTTTNLTRDFISRYYQLVRADTWGNGQFTPNVNYPAQNIDGRPYNADPGWPPAGVQLFRNRPMGGGNTSDYVEGRITTVGRRP